LFIFLFNIYVRKLPEKCISDIFQFADDTTLAVADPLEVVTTILSTSFNATKEFCFSHRLISKLNSLYLKQLENVFHRITISF